MAIDLRANPFYLDDEGIAWVENTLASLTEDEKIQQLFFPCLFVYDEKGIDEMLSKIHPAGVMLRPASAREDIQAVEVQDPHAFCRKPGKGRQRRRHRGHCDGLSHGAVRHAGL